MPSNRSRFAVCAETICACSQTSRAAAASSAAPPVALQRNG